MSKSAAQMVRTRRFEPPRGHFPPQPELLERGEVDGDRFLRRIVDACASAIAVLDELGSILYVSRGWGSFAADDGLAELNGSDGRYLGIGNSSTREANLLTEDIERILAGRDREFHKEYSVAGDDGPRWFLMHIVRLDLPEPCRFRVLLTREDVTRHKQAEEALRNLGGRLINAQEEERSRVARELHDDLNQQLAILSIELEQLRQKIPVGDQRLNKCVKALWTRARGISSSIQQISYQLHPDKLDRLGLAAAIKSLCDELSEHHEIKIAFRHDGLPRVLPKEITLCVFRIAQESLQNIIRHSNARNAQVLLQRTSKGIHLGVSDNGRGFDAHSPGTKQGLGFISMRERLRLVGGRISIRSQPSRGTQIDALVPIEPEPQTS